MLVFSFTARANWQGRNHKMVAFDVRCHYLSHGQAVEEMSGSATHQIHSLCEGILLLREPAEGA